MHCCNPSNASSDCRLGPSDFVGPTMAGRIAALHAFLVKLMVPEPTDLPCVPAGNQEDRLFGAIKTMFWMFASIGIGTALAVLCN